jgi:hypothetical protein
MFSPAKTKSVIRAILFLSCLVLFQGHAEAFSSQVDQATKCFEAYVQALQQGSKQQAGALWNKEEVKRYEVYDWQWGDLIFRGFDLRQLKYRITKVEDEDNLVVLTVEWYYLQVENAPVATDRRYFVEEDGKTVGANPIFALTRGWNQKESEYFVYHYKNGVEELDSDLLARMDRFYEKVVGLLYLEYQDKIDYYRCDSTSEVGRLFAASGSLARCRPQSRVIASVREFVPHEIVHVISHAILPPGEERIPPEYLNEGLAYYLGGASFFSPQLLLSWAKQKMRGETVLIDSLIRRPWSCGVNQGAGLVSSFVKFLVDTKGVEEFKYLFSAGRNWDDQKKALKRIFPKGMGEAQQEWERFVLEAHVPEIRVGEPVDYKSVCDIRDAQGDDKGDGDYEYPRNDRVVPGMFDFTRLKLSLDEEMVYFRLYFSSLSDEEILSDEGFNGTFAAILLDTDDAERSGGTRLFFDNGSFELTDSDGYEFAVEVSSAGVLVYDRDWIWQALFLKAASSDSHIRDDQFLFAVPQEIIGLPNENWKIQVLTGGQEGGFRNVTYGVGRFMRVAEFSSSERGGGGTNTEFNPDVYDILTEKDQDQVEILGSYQVERNKRAVIPMLRLSGK